MEMEGGDNVGTLTLAVGHVVKKGGTMAWNFGKLRWGLSSSGREHNTLGVQEPC